MPTVSERKLKLLHLFRLLWEKTDSRHTLTLSQMLEELKNLGIPAERKSLYDDLETLRRFGVAIGTRKDKHFSYFLARRPFSMEELSLLLRGLQGAGLPPEQAAPLEGKVAALGSCFQAQALLQGGELPWGDEDSPAPSGALSLRERLEQAAAENRPVALTRQEWSLSDGKLVGSSGTAVVFPRRLHWEKGAAWLEALSETLEPVYLPLDWITRAETLPPAGEAPAPAAQERLVFEFPARLLNQVSGAFQGRLRLENAGKSKLRVAVRAPVDEVLFRLLFALGPDVRLLSPKKAAEQFRERAKAMAKAYKS